MDNSENIPNDVEKKIGGIQKRRPNVKKEICEYIADGLNFKQAMAKAGISHQTFNNWQRDDAVFTAAINTALLAQNSAIRAYARASLVYLVQIQDVEEVTSEFDIGKDKDGKDVEVLTKRKVTRKKMLPPAALIQYALNNLEPETFADRHDLTSKGEGINNGFLELYKQAMNANDKPVK